MGYIGCNEYAIYVSIRYFVQPTYWELGYVQGDEYVLYVWFRHFVQPTYWELGYVQGDEYAIYVSIRYSFSQDVSGWNTPSNTAFTNIFSGATAFQIDFDCSDVINGPPNSCNDWTVLTDSTFASAISRCLAEAPNDGLCKDYGLERKTIGIMPDWNTSLVTNMNGCTASGSYCTSSSSSYSSYRRMFNRNLPLTATFPNGIHRVLRVCSICLIPLLRSTNLLGVGTRPR